MAKLSLCASVPVVLRESGELVGYIKNAYFDKIGKFFAYFRIETPSSGALLLKVSDGVPRDVLLLDDRSRLIPAEDVELSGFVEELLGLPAYTLAGASKGNVLDAHFLPSGKLTRLTLSSGEISAASIACVGDVVLLKSARAGAPARIPRPKKDYPVRLLSAAAQNESDQTSVSSPSENGDLDPHTHPKTAEDAPTSSFAGEALAQNAAAYPASKLSAPPAVALSKGEGPLFSQGALNAVLQKGEEVNFEALDPHTPTRVICDYSFLVGRTLSAELRSFSGELLAREGAEITPFVVDLARAHGRLVELTLLSARRDGE